MGRLTGLAALVPLLVLMPGPAAAQWLGPRGDSRSSGHVPGVADLGEERAVRWRLPTGFAADGASVLSPPADGLPVIVVRDGNLQAYGPDGRLRWTSAPEGYDGLAGWLPAPLDDGDRALLAIRSTRDMAVFSAAGARLASTGRVDPVYGPSPAFTWLVQDPPLIVAAPPSTYSVFAWGDPQSAEFATPLWDIDLAPATTAFRLLAGDFAASGDAGLLGMDAGSVFVIDPDTGGLVARPPTFFTGVGSGLSVVIDLEGDGVDEVAVAHTTDTGYGRIGVMRPVSGAWVWLVEYLPPDRRAAVRATSESVRDIDGDGAPELVASVFGSRAFEAAAYPAGLLGDVDGVDLPERWVTLVVDLATGAVEHRLPDRVVRGVLGGEDDPLLAVADLSDGASLANSDLELLRFEPGASPTPVVSLAATDLARAAAPNRLDLHNPREATGLIGSAERTVGVVRDPATGIPDRYVLIDVSVDPPAIVPLFGAEGGEVVPVRAESDGRSVWLGPDGYQLRDVALEPVGASVPGPGRTSSVRIGPSVPDGEGTAMLLRGNFASVAFAPAGGRATPERQFAVTDLFVGTPQGLYVDGRLQWATRVDDLAGRETVVAFDALSGALRRIVLDVPPNAANAMVAAGSSGLIGLTYVDDSRSGDARYRMRLIDPGLDEPSVSDWPLDFDRAPLTPPLAWEYGAATYFAASTFNRIRVYDREGTVQLAITSEGQNRPLIAADLEGDGRPDLIAGAAAPSPGAPRRYCAWSGDTGGRLWCEDDASASASLTAVVTALPIRGETDDLVLAYPFGEVRRMDGATGAVLWRRCLAAGAARDLGPTTSDAPCEGARIASPASVDLDGDGSTELVVGSTDGLVYAVSADGEVLWTESLRGGVAQLAVADTDGDGTHEVVASLATGELVALGRPSVSPPTAVRDVAIDPLSGELGTDDIDATLERRRVAARWDAEAPASGWRVVVYTAEDVAVAELTVPGAAREALLDPVPLAAGGEYYVAVQAVSASDGTYSAEAVSDGFVVAALDAIVITGFEIAPAEVVAGVPQRFEATVRVFGPSPLARVRIDAAGRAEATTTLDGATAAYVVSELELSGEDLAAPGPLTFAAEVDDVEGRTVEATFVVSVLAPSEDAGADAGDDAGPDAGGGPDASDDAGPDADAGDETGADAAGDGGDAAGADTAGGGELELGGGGISGCACDATGGPPAGSAALVGAALAAVISLRRRTRSWACNATR